MALLECTECGGKISDKALTCPHCGYQIVSSNTETEESYYEWYKLNRIYDEDGYTGRITKLLLRHIPFREKASILIAGFHWVNVIVLIIANIINLFLTFEDIEDFWWLLIVGPLLSYVGYVLFEILLGFYGMIVDLCKDVHKLANK